MTGLELRSVDSYSSGLYPVNSRSLLGPGYDIPMEDLDAK
jgi:hypothetical protein